MEASRSAIVAPIATCCVCQSAVFEGRCKECGAAAQAGGFRILRLISKGPHGRVYLAQDESSRRVALKELAFATVPNIKEIEAFEREAAVLAELHHPRVPKFISSVRDGEDGMRQVREEALD
jgi:serine/threonine protein kinase